MLWELVQDEIENEIESECNRKLEECQLEARNKEIEPDFELLEKAAKVGNLAECDMEMIWNVNVEIIRWIEWLKKKRQEVKRKIISDDLQ